MVSRFPTRRSFQYLLLGILLIGSGAVMTWKLVFRSNNSHSVQYLEKEIPVDTVVMETDINLRDKTDTLQTIITGSEKREKTQVKGELIPEPKEIRKTARPQMTVDSGAVVSKRAEPSPDADNEVTQALHEVQAEMVFSYKMEKPVHEDTILLQFDSTAEASEPDPVIRELCDGINVALVRKNGDSTRAKPPVYQYLKTFNEAILRRFNDFSYQSLADFKTGKRVAYSDYIFQSGRKLIKVRMIAFEEMDERDAVFLPEAFSVNIVSWKDDVIEMDWFINAGILEIPPEKIEIGVSGKHYIEIAFGNDAVYEIGVAN